MQSVLRIVLVDPRTESREDLKRILANMDPVWVEAECTRYEELSDILGQTGAEIAAIAMNGQMGPALETIASVRRSHPNTRIFVLSDNSDSQQILQAMRAGAHEYLTTPVQMEDLLPALDRVRQLMGNGPEQTSKVIAVTGVVGGVGSTSVAVNLGCSLATDPNRRVVLVDLDMLMGDADVCLDLVHNYTLIDVVENINRLDFTLLKRSLVQHDSGLWFLPHPSSLAEVSRVQAESLKRLIGLLKATFTHVVLNLSNGFRDTDITAMEVSDVILMVAQLDVSCVRNLNRLFKALEGNDLLRERIRVVLNRVGARDLNIPVDKAEEMIGRPISWQIPNDWANAIAARTAGVPLVLHAPRSKVSTAIARMADDLGGALESPVENGKTTKKRSLFSILTGSA